MGEKPTARKKEKKKQFAWKKVGKENCKENCILKIVTSNAYFALDKKRNCVCKKKTEQQQSV